MSLSMYTASVPVFQKMLRALAGVLEKAEAHVQQHKLEPAALLQARLFPDMFPLVGQVLIATDFAKGASARLAGREVPRYDDTEQSFAELQQRITKTLGYIESLPREAFDAAAERAITHGAGERARHFERGDDYLTGFVLPNFFFHVTTAYAILRHNGVPIGKRDFLGL
ncbi:DUF1993 family protein [Massilia sp. BSC265]|uniref:DUF1993 domain-containing protein n=1 Tax=Massilia sp. BSC265 TaxID=1549812 RepID=UPI0004E87ED4|nr:DUF1993 domain-containing protein [Massilia sp. BSC265]KFI05758.1 hypothetical protein JN27_20165 [Massilia sp. BSC265]